MTCNETGKQLIKSYERCRLRSYQDSGGIWTCGWGQTGPDVGPYTVWSQAYADQRFAEHLKREVEDPINNMIDYELDENEFGALCSFVFNIGSGNFSRSAVRKSINDGDFEDVPTHMRVWNRDHAGHVLEGLVKRREAEINLWNKPAPEPAPSPLVA